ncbi:MAG: type I-C CRISPR-associated protein Cas7/Csd2 [Cyanobacteria bacterium P01_E01_bin.48]
MSTNGTSIHTEPNRRHDFVLLFDVKDGNPNGDPDGGNLPRTDPETFEGLVTDVAIKRKVRNFIATYAEYEAEEDERSRLKIFVEHRGILNDQIRRAYTEQGIPTGKPYRESVSKEPVLNALRDLAPHLPAQFTFTDTEEVDAEDVTASLEYSGELSSAELKVELAALQDFPAWKQAKTFVEGVAKKAGKPDKNRANADRARDWMCSNFYDVRMFGAVMSTGLNAGQVRGPMQLTFARSLDPVLPQDLAVTRVAVTDPKDREKLQTIGRKTLIPYGLYRAYGFYSPYLAQQTSVDRRDLELFWDALVHMWDFDRSASRGMMAPRGLYIFSHDKRMGNAPAHKLFQHIQVNLREEVMAPRSFGDYQVAVNDTDLPEGLTLTTLAEG